MSLDWRNGLNNGTSEWKNYQVVLDVPGDATGIAFGILLDGTGTAWINGAKFEVVDSSVPVTDMHLNMTTPSNLSFENLALLILQ